MKIAGYTYDFTTVNVGIPGIPNERVNEELSGISCDVATDGREIYHGSGREASGINDGIIKLSGKMSMTMELLDEIVESSYFQDGLDMAAPFDMSITVKAGVAPYNSIDILLEGVRLERPPFDWKKGNSALEIEIAYKCLRRTKDGRTF